MLNTRSDVQFLRGRPRYALTRSRINFRGATAAPRSRSRGVASSLSAERPKGSARLAPQPPDFRTPNAIPCACDCVDKGTTCNSVLGRTACDACRGTVMHGLVTGKVLRRWRCRESIAGNCGNTVTEHVVVSARVEPVVRFGFSRKRAEFEASRATISFSVSKDANNYFITGEMFFNSAPQILRFLTLPNPF